MATVTHLQSAPSSLDEVLPSAPFRERHHCTIDAPIEQVWPACLAVRPGEIRAFGPLLAIRTLPSRLRGGTGAPADDRPLLEQFEDEGFVVLRRDLQPQDGIATVIMGAAGRFWSPTQNAPVELESADAFHTFAEPGNAKTAVSLVATARGDRTEVVTETVVDGTDAAARRRFAPYWALIRLPSGLIRRSWLAAVRRRSAGRSRFWPRREPGLPPGQRLLDVMPRFSDNPLHAPPPVPADARLAIAVDGVARAQVPLAELADRDTITADFHCVTTWSVRALQWKGSRLCAVLDEAGIDRSTLPPFAVAEAGDGYRAIFDTGDLMADDVLLATHLNGRTLGPRHGAPLRLVTPAQYGYKNVKHLTRIEFVPTEPASTLGPKEHLRARVALEERHARWPAWSVRLPYRILVGPTVIVAERSAARAESSSG